MNIDVTVERRVMKIMIDHPETRDSDYILLYFYWKRELDGKNIDLETALLNGDITPAESITRARRKLQEIHVNLRGEKWEARHKMEVPVCTQLMLFEIW